MQRYITWKRVQTSPTQFIDPNTNNTFNEVTNWATFTETPYQIADWRFISVIEYPDNTTQERINSLMAEYSAFEFTFITEEEANTLLSELWDVKVSNFNFTDNRPIDIII